MAEPAGLNQDFRDLLIAFTDHHVEFLLIGGWALALHGHGRGTDDMDVFVRASPENAAKIFHALAAFGAPVEAHGVSPELFAHEEYGYRFGVKPNLIEVLTTIDGVSFDEAWADHEELTLEGRTVPFIGRSALIKNKRAAGRAKDLADLAWLERDDSERQE